MRKCVAPWIEVGLRGRNSEQRVPRYALRLVARHGGVASVQRVLCGESASEAQLAVMLTAARAAFTQISLAFSDVFLAEANDVIAGFRPRPPGEPRQRKGGPSSVQLVAGFFVMQLDRAIAAFRTGEPTALRALDSRVA